MGTTPTFVSVSSVTTGNPTPGTHDVDDILLLFVESDGAAAVTTPSGYGIIDSFPIVASTTRLSGFYKFATSSSEGAPTVTGPADHTLAAIAVYRGVNKSNPFHQVSGSTIGSNTGKAFIGLTTELDNCMIVNILGWAADSAGPLRSTGPTNADLGSVTERLDAGTTTASGGGLYLCDGTKDAKGSFTFTTIVLSLASIANLATIALQAADQAFGQKSRICNTRH